MMLLRWLSLRLFFSLLALPFVAMPILVLLHRYWFPEVYFQDLPVLFLIWLLLFVTVHTLLSTVGNRRFHYLDDVGWQHLKSSNEYLIPEIFQYLQKLLESGLLPLTRRPRFEEQVLKRFFDYYAQHVDDPAYRQKVRLCLQKRIHPARAYQVLKTYLLQQEELTVERIDLAGELLEYQPDDAEVVLYMAERYLADGQSHSHAELFYQKLLEWNRDEYVERIVELCLSRVLQHRRSDDFAAWLLVRAHALKEDARQQIGVQLYHIHRIHEKIRRSDALARAVAGIVAELPQEVRVLAQAEEQKREARTLRHRLARAQYHTQQWLLLGWDYVKLYRHYIYYGLTMLAFGLMVYLFLPAGTQMSDRPGSETIETVPPGQKLFTVQVAATKNARAAQREVARLKKAGYDAYLVQPKKRGGFYKIRVGKYTSKVAAEKAARTLLKKKLIREYFLVNFQPARAPRKKR